MKPTGQITGIDNNNTNKTDDLFVWIGMALSH